VKTQIAKTLKPLHKLKDILHCLNLKKRTYYDNYYTERRRSKSYSEKYFYLLRIIYTVFISSNKSYGSERIWAELKNRKEPIIVSEKIIRKIVKEQGWTPLRKKIRRYSSYDKNADTNYFPNLLQRDFKSEKPLTKLVTDITEFHLPFGKVYLNAVIDCFNGEMVAYKIGKHPTLELVLNTIKKLILKLPFWEYIVLHSDRGVQYHSGKYSELLNSRGIIQSMSKKGSSPDNAAAEGFFGHLKEEFFYYRDFSNCNYESFCKKLHNYIYWFNNNRIKKSLNWQSPVQFRKNYKKYQFIPTDINNKNNDLLKLVA